MRKIIIDALHYYAKQLKSSDHPILLKDLLQTIGDALHTILMGEKRKSELKIS